MATSSPPAAALRVAVSSGDTYGPAVYVAYMPLWRCSAGAGCGATAGRARGLRVHLPAMAGPAPAGGSATAVVRPLAFAWWPTRSRSTRSTRTPTTRWWVRCWPGPFAAVAAGRADGGGRTRQARPAGAGAAADVRRRPRVATLAGFLLMSPPLSVGRPERRPARVEPHVHYQRTGCASI